MISTGDEVNLEFDIFSSLLLCFISIIHFFVCKEKVKNREEIFSGDLCQDISEKVIKS